ncbi:unnamed protein product [Brassica oleracea var. botrytis]
MDIMVEKTLFLFVCFILSCFFIISTPRSRRNPLPIAATPPGPPRLPLIGNINLVGKDPHCSFANLSKTYGPVMSLKLGFLNTVVVTSPEAAREVLRTHDQVLSNRGSNNSINFINHQELSLVWLPSSSARWRLLRKLSATQLLFSPQRMEATKGLRLNKVKDLIKFMSESSEREEAVDISRALFTTTLNIMSNLLFSVDLGSYDTVIGVMEAIGNPDAANYFPFLRFLDLQGNIKKMKDNSERLLRVFRGFIDAKIAEKALRNNPKDVTDGDFVDALLHLTEGDEPELNTNEIEHFLATDVKGRDYELTPFGGGRRICPGLPLAVKTVNLMLASLLYSFDWKLPNGINPEDLDMDETFGLTLHKTNPLRAIPIKKRPIN